MPSVRRSKLIYLLSDRGPRGFMGLQYCTEPSQGEFRVFRVKGLGANGCLSPAKCINTPSSGMSSAVRRGKHSMASGVHSRRNLPHEA